MVQKSIPESDHRGQQSAPVVSGHTPTPWDYFVGNANGRGLIRIETGCDNDDAGKHIASMPRGAQSEANAAFIVRAVNSHEALVKALEAADRICKSALPKFNWGASFLDAEAIAALNEGMLTIERAVAALASAREVQPTSGGYR